jgi:predicted RND superfamily exporter protein
MKLDECEETILSVTAEIDGEAPLLSAEQTALHLSRCEACRMEIKRQKAAVDVFQKQERRAVQADLWLKIEKRITGSETVSEPVQTRYFFLLLGAILVAYKLLEMIPASDFGFLFKLAPLVFVAALFYFFRENPFKINTELKLEG